MIVPHINGVPKIQMKPSVRLFELGGFTLASPVLRFLQSGTTPFTPGVATAAGDATRHWACCETGAHRYIYPE